MRGVAGREEPAAVMNEQGRRPGTIKAQECPHTVGKKQMNPNNSMAKDSAVVTI